jgi:plasmid stabilization system protein ParE
LADIRDYIVKRGAPETAVKFVNRLMNEIHTLESLPKGHQRRRKSRKSPHPLWQLPVDSYRVIYTIFEERKVVRVLGVQHGGRRTWP